VTPRTALLSILAAAWVCHPTAAWSQAAPSPSPAAAPSAPPSEASIEMPKLVRFEQAAYPPEALKAGLEAQVILRLTIDTEGNVTDAAVTEPAGHGFDEAAQAAARRFRFEPARRDGQPLAVQILYRYDFTLTEVEVPVPDAAPPERGELSGRLFIEDTETPLVGAVVTVMGPERTTMAVTDAGGRFRFADLPPGSYVVRVSAEGFEPTDNEESIGAGEATEVTYRIALESGELVVTVRGERPPREVTRRRLERREIERIPGTGGDAIRSVQSLPGVARPPGLAGLLIVRGSSPEDTAAFVDGSQVPLIYHFGGLSSVIPTELLERIDFYPGNFGARYGQLMGGIVDVSLREPDTRCFEDYGKPSERTGCYHGLAQVDLIDARILAQGPLGPLDNWSFAVGARRSWVDAWLRPALEAADAGVTTAPVYQDYQAILSTRPTPTSRLRLQSYGTEDRLEILIRDPIAQDPGFGGTIRFGTSFWRVQGIYESELSRDVELYTMLSVGRTKFDFSVSSFLFDLDVVPIDMRSEFGWKIMPGLRANVGLDYNISLFDIRVRIPPPPAPGEPAGGPFSTRPPLERAVTDIGFRPAWYTELEVVPAPRLRLVPSFRVDYARDSGQADLSPRFNARYDLIPGADQEGAAPGSLRTTLKGGVGAYYQPPQFQETDAAFGTPGLESNRAIHYSLGVEQELSERIEVSVEGFYKDMDNLVGRRPDQSGRLINTNEGQGYSMGLETLVRVKPSERFFGWLAYTLSRAVRTDPGQDERLFEFDQTHNMTVLGSYRLGRGWEYGARFRIVSGPLETPVVGPPSLPALYAADASSYTPLQGEPNSVRLPLFHQLDMRLDKRWQFRTWRLSAYLDVQNVYNNQAVEGVVYNYDFSQQTYQTGLPIIPSIGVRGEF
jgi:TonB family protein